MKDYLPNQFSQINRLGIMIWILALEAISKNISIVNEDKRINAKPVMLSVHFSKMISLYFIFQVESEAINWTRKILRLEECREGL